MKRTEAETMQVDILKKNENKALERTEIAFKIEGCSTTPSRKELRGKIAALTNSKEELLVVDRIKHRFGSKLVTGTARAYSKEGQLRKIEEAYLIARNEGKKAKKGEQAEEKPGEEEEKAEGEKEKGEGKKKDENGKEE
ncbi:MAG: 30S ribosomal protein S24e [Candidatus Diapherotrites archaeon]|uniref:Small ribosomal subunit protein eS24 n=1 Tax=Candidatus Iainarchaeum sp. TaxID=3101447 RepID=A0A938YP15_9ARCH|nr:30S ribosomal protein S24e [Candidatus Diapherotrites archaeon]